MLNRHPFIPAESLNAAGSLMYFIPDTNHHFFNKGTSTMKKVVLLLVAAGLGVLAYGEGVMRQVKMETSVGVIELQLDSTAAPATVANFIEYAKSGFYSGTIFHRVIPGFMIQGGGFTKDMDEKQTRPAIKNEAKNGLTNLRGTIAMARTGDPHSATAQFFINTVDNGFLNHTAENMNGWGYCVFGKVTNGMNVVDSIVKVPTTTKKSYFENNPVTPVVITKVTVEEKAAPVVGDGKGC